MTPLERCHEERAGLADANRPNGSFLFLGPTGVDKTDLCKALAEFLFDTEEAMVRIDMSEFMEKHSVAGFRSSVRRPPAEAGHPCPVGKFPSIPRFAGWTKDSPWFADATEGEERHCA